MPILESLHNSLRMIGMSSHQSVQKHVLNARNSTMLSIFGINIVCNIGFLMYETNNLMEFTDSLYLTFTAILAVSILINLIWKMRQLFAFVNRVDDIVDQRLCNSVSKTIYSKTQAKMQKVARILRIMLVEVTPIVVNFLPFVGSFVDYFTTDLGADALELPLPMWFPFDVRNPVGYTLAVCIESIFTVNIELFTMCIMIVAIGPCLTLISISNDLRYSLYTLNKNARANAKPSELAQQFHQVVDFHANAKRLIKDFSATMEFVFAVLFSWSLASICSGLLILQIEWERDANSSVLLQRCNQMSTAFSIVFICCEFGHRLSRSFDKIDTDICRLHWYKFPAQLWKLIPIFMVGAQEPTNLNVFGTVSCTREDFKGVVNSGFSYYMVLRQFDYGN